MPFVIPFFIAHQGCPHQCLFCNQHSITGTAMAIGDMRRQIETAIVTWRGYCRQDKPAQFAFYGGSFTCQSMERQLALLEAVRPWLQSGEVATIRLSTRPDCLTAEICAMLRVYGVGVVELGVQSLDDTVLKAARRGHDAQDCVRAVALLQEAGIDTGMQLMPGLPGESRASFRRTVAKAVALSPDFVRIYPALVVRGSALAELFHQGYYRPLSLNMAVALSRLAWRRFTDAGIRVVRMGLQPSPSLEENVLAGPYHPAFGELVLARDWQKRVRALLARHPRRTVRLSISPRDLSSFNGINTINRRRFRELGLAERLEVILDHTLERGKMYHAVC